MTRDRTFAFATLAVALASGALMIAGNEWQRHIGWALWPLLIVLPVTAGALRRRARHEP
jgi:hypothetical protein